MKMSKLKKKIEKERRKLKKQKNSMKERLEWCGTIMFIALIVSLIIILAPIIMSKIIQEDIINISVEGWLSYCGSIVNAIIVATITIMALRKTIKHERKMEEENQRLSVTPFLNVNVQECKEKCVEYFNGVIEEIDLDLEIGSELSYTISIGFPQFKKKETIYFNEDEQEIINLYVFIENIGNGTIPQFNLVGITNREDKEEVYKVKYNIYTNKGILLNIKIKVKKTTFTILVGGKKHLDFTLDFAYSDLLNNLYEQSLKIHIGIDEKGISGLVGELDKTNISKRNIIDVYNNPEHKKYIDDMCELIENVEKNSLDRK